MKNRTGFVSNSSSSSFAINLSDLTGKQMSQILNINDDRFKDDPWRIYTEDGKLKGSTWMDNFSMSDFFEQIGVPDQYIEWGD